MSQDHIENARVPLQIERMRIAQEQGICCFCREHFENYHTAPVEIENNSFLVAKNDFPYDGATSHWLIVSKRHVTTPLELSIGEWGDFQAVLLKLSEIDPHPGAGLVMRYGEPSFTGATIAHLHAHVIYGVSGTPQDEKISVFLGYKK